MSYETKALPYIPCCIARCVDGAQVKLWTPTGWVQVCFNHYPDIPWTPRPQTNKLIEDIRAAYLKSHAYAHKQANLFKGWYPGTPRLQRERQPGEDDE